MARGQLPEGLCPPAKGAGPTRIALLQNPTLPQSVPEDRLPPPGTLPVGGVGSEHLAEEVHRVASFANRVRGALL